MTAVLKGVGKINGDGWKDTTFLGQVVYVWNTELPEPYKPGQYPRIGNPGWSASTDQYDFTPATAEEAKNAVETLVAELEKQQAEPTVREVQTVAALRAAALPTLPFAVFDEFGKGADDRVQDYARNAVRAALDDALGKP